MQMFYILSVASVFYILSTQGRDLNGLQSLVFNETDKAVVSSMFKNFVRKFNKAYLNNPEEYSRRLSVFKQSLERHAKLNARELELNGTAVYGINQFSDWTPEEFRGFLKRGIQEDHVLFANDAMTPSGCCTLELNSSNTPPNRDWRKDGKVSAVKNQGKCGSCWAFTATECVESQWAIHYNHQSATDLSVQELISCSRSKGCSGGSTLLAFNWLQTKNYTLVPAKEFPYVDKETTCKRNLLTEKGVRIRCGCEVQIRKENTRMKDLVGQHGPLGVNVDATMWHDYLGECSV